jgi:hypothetical protein
MILRWRRSGECAEGAKRFGVRQSSAAFGRANMGVFDCQRGIVGGIFARRESARGQAHSKSWRPFGCARRRGASWSAAVLCRFVVGAEIGTGGEFLQRSTECAEFWILAIQPNCLGDNA